jgi:hypothetical protein
MQYLKIADYIIFLGVLAGLILYRRLHSRGIKILVWLLVATLFVEIATPFKLVSAGANNQVMYTIFTPVECSFYALIYYVSLQRKASRTFVLACWLVAVCFMVFNLLYIQGTAQFNSYAFIASCIAITLFAFTYLLQQYSAAADVKFYKQPLFLVSIGVLLFYPPGIVSLGLITDIYAWDKQLAINIYKINGILNPLLYTMHLIAIIVDSKQKMHTSAAHEQ